MNLFILIPIFNNLQFTKNCLHNLDENIDRLKDLKKDKIRISVVIIDDGSTDGSGEWISKHYPDYHVLKGNGQLWWSGAINMGVDYIIKNNLSADYVLFWNNDIEIDESYFPGLHDILVNNSKDHIIGSKIYVKSIEQTVWSMGGYFNPKTGEKYMHGYMKPDDDQYGSERYVDWLPGMGTVLPVSVFKDIGLINDNYFPQYYGDLDITYRARLFGYKILVKPELKIWNSIENTGIKHKGNFKNFIKSFSSIKSLYNIKKDFLFYRSFSKSPRVYAHLSKKYFYYIGGYFKWKLLGIFKSGNK